ncbi:D-glycerate dehydrogenase [Candidatus Bathyarchaeota archaeon]|nr:D-glycerate dehydrogenase [Candidatus Bathyarchaeota archaeon]
MKPLVFVTREIPSNGLELLKKFCEVKVWKGKLSPSKHELINNVKEAYGLLCMLNDRVDSEVIDSALNLRVISSMSVGFDHIDVQKATKKGIYVTNTPEVLTEATADLAWALLMAAARLIVKADVYVRKGKWKEGWSPMLFLGESVYGKTLGIIGAGRIGLAVAARALGFNMKKIYFDIRRLPKEKESELGLTYQPLEDLLKEADYVTIHTPLTKETYHMIGENQLKLMKSSAILINTSRGAVINEAALIKALKEKWIAGAALDVFEEEPIKPNHPILKLDNVVITPHIGSATKETRFKMAEIAARNLISVLKGEPPIYLVNSEVQEIMPLQKIKVIS